MMSIERAFMIFGSECDRRARAMAKEAQAGGSFATGSKELATAAAILAQIGLAAMRAATADITSPDPEPSDA